VPQDCDQKIKEGDIIVQGHERRRGLRILHPNIAHIFKSISLHYLHSYSYIVTSQLFPSGQSIEKRKAEAKANPKAKAKTKVKAAGKQKKDEVKTEPEAGGHFENLKEEDCLDEPVDDDDENLDGSPCGSDENNGDDQEQGDSGTIFGDGDM